MEKPHSIFIRISPELTDITSPHILLAVSYDYPVLHWKWLGSAPEDLLANFQALCELLDVLLVTKIGYSWTIYTTEIRNTKINLFLCFPQRATC